MVNFLRELQLGLVAGDLTASGAQAGGVLARLCRLDPRLRYPVETEFMHDLLHANTEFTGGPVPPLIERNPLGLWRTLALLSFALNLVLLFLLSRH